MKTLVLAASLFFANMAWSQSFKTLTTDQSGDDYSQNMDVTEFASALSKNQDSIFFKITHAKSRPSDYGYLLALDTNSVATDGHAINQTNLYSGSPNNSMTADVLILVYENSFFPGVIKEVRDANDMPTSLNFEIDTSDAYSLTVKFALTDIGGDEAMNVLAGVGAFDISGSGPSDIIPNTNFIKLVNGTTLGLAFYKRRIGFYPNPARDLITIGESGRVEIYDASGKLQLSQDVEAGATINISHLAAGYYFLNSEGNVSKLVKL